MLSAWIGPLDTHARDDMARPNRERGLGAVILSFLEPQVTLASLSHACSAQHHLYEQFFLISTLTSHWYRWHSSSKKRVLCDITTLWASRSTSQNTKKPTRMDRRTQKSYFTNSLYSNTRHTENISAYQWPACWRLFSASFLKEATYIDSIFSLAF